MQDATTLKQRVDELWHALACALCVPEPTNKREEQMIAFARKALGVGPQAAHQAALVALSKYGVADEWECPTGNPTCAKNCGDYGCGN